MSRKFALVAAVAAFGMFAAASHAAITVSASNNATVQPAGPRTGANGKNFFNLEGTTVGGASFTSYGVVDFPSIAFQLSPTVTSVSQLTLAFAEANSGFTAPGSVQVYLASSAAATIEPGAYTVPAADASFAPGGLDVTSAASAAAFGSLLNLGSIQFNTTGNTASGTVDALSLSSLTPDQSDLLTGLITAGSNIRFVLVANSATGAATWAGYSSTSQAAPSLSLEVSNAAIPEPAAMSLLVLPAAALLRRRK